MQELCSHAVGTLVQSQERLYARVSCTTYARSTEGFDTPDLDRGQTFLDEYLKAPPTLHNS
jgi:hypothetical protein